MRTAFTRTMRALGADGFAWSIGGIVVAIVLLAAWAAWLGFATVAKYEDQRFGAVAVLLPAMTLAACAVPARRAARVDPIATLRAE